MTETERVMGALDTARLREVAEAAAEATGAWRLRHHPEFRHPDDRGLYGKYGYVIRPDAHGGMFNDKDAAEHVATFDPPTVLALLDRLDARGGRGADTTGRGGDVVSAQGLSREVIAAMWREHAECTWLSNGVNVVWSCGIIHPGPIHMQPTTRDRHLAALVMTQVEADRVMWRSDTLAEILKAARTRAQGRVTPPASSAQPDEDGGAE